MESIYRKLAVACICIMGLVSCNLYARDELSEKLEITSDAFREGEMIPKKYTGYGENISPDIKWAKPPVGTKFMAIICEDPDAQIGTWTHWVAFNIPYRSGVLAEGIPPREALPDGTIQGVNDFKKIGYDGPHPPYGTHRYYFRVYAVDMRLNIGANVTRADLLKALQNNIVAEGSLMGRYEK